MRISLKGAMRRRSFAGANKGVRGSSSATLLEVDVRMAYAKTPRKWVDGLTRFEHLLGFTIMRAMAYYLLQYVEQPGVLLSWLGGVEGR